MVNIHLCLQVVVFLPALCRKMDVPYCIVKGKARLGRLVHKKTATAVCLTGVRRCVSGGCGLVVKGSA